MEKQIKGDVVRLLLLGTYYRKPLDYNKKALDDAANLYIDSRNLQVSFSDNKPQGPQNGNGYQNHTFHQIWIR